MGTPPQNAACEVCLENFGFSAVIICFFCVWVVLSRWRYGHNDRLQGLRNTFFIFFSSFFIFPYFISIAERVSYQVKSMKKHQITTLKRVPAHQITHSKLHFSQIATC